jgi:hypothetical protein
MVFIQPVEEGQRVIIRFFFKERLSTEYIHAPLKTRFGDITDSNRIVQGWGQDVRQGR